MVHTHTMSEILANLFIEIMVIFKVHIKEKKKSSLIQEFYDNISQNNEIK